MCIGFTLTTAWIGGTDDGWYRLLNWVPFNGCVMLIFCYEPGSKPQWHAHIYLALTLFLILLFFWLSRSLFLLQSIFRYLTSILGPDHWFSAGGVSVPAHFFFAYEEVMTQICFTKRKARAHFPSFLDKKWWKLLNRIVWCTFGLRPVHHCRLKQESDFGNSWSPPRWDVVPTCWWPTLSLCL